MKHLLLSTYTRQLIILVLVFALLWQGKLRPGLDGFILTVFTTNRSNANQMSMWKGDYIEGNLLDISETYYSERGVSAKYVLESIPVASATWIEPNKIYLFLNDYFPLSRILPLETRLDGGWVFVLKLTPEQYELLQAARQRDSKLDWTRVPSGEVRTGTS